MSISYVQRFQIPHSLPLKTFLSPPPSLLAVLAGVKWCLTLVIICIPLVITDKTSFHTFARHLKTFSHDIAVKPSAHFPLDRVVYFCCCRAAAVLYVLWTPTHDEMNTWQVFFCTPFLSGLSVSCTRFWWSIFFPSVASSVCAISMNLLSSPSLRILFLFQILKLIAYF